MEDLDPGFNDDPQGEGLFAASPQNRTPGAQLSALAHFDVFFGNF